MEHQELVEKQLNSALYHLRNAANDLSLAAVIGDDRLGSRCLTRHVMALIEMRSEVEHIVNGDDESDK